MIKVMYDLGVALDLKCRDAGPSAWYFYCQQRSFGVVETPFSSFEKVSCPTDAADHTVSE